MAKEKPVRDAADTERNEGDLDAGAYIGHEPELEDATLPGGMDRRDERVAAYDTRSSGEGALDRRLQETDVEGHRDGARADDDQIREAGENR